MDYSFYLKNNFAVEKKLKEFGFMKIQNSFFLEKNLLQKGLYAKIEIAEKIFDVKVFDRDFGDEYIPFGLKNVNNSVKTEVENMVKTIIDNCFNKIDYKNELIDYMQSKYGTICEFPWLDYPNYCTFKTKNKKKWYAIIMDIKQERLCKGGDNLVDIINVKVDSTKLNNLIDNQNFFPAYHMNKKNWVTILLDKNADITIIKNLIDLSYSIVENENKK